MVDELLKIKQITKQSGKYICYNIACWDLFDIDTLDMPGIMCMYQTNLSTCWLCYNIYSEVM